MVKAFLSDQKRGAQYHKPSKIKYNKETIVLAIDCGIKLSQLTKDSGSRKRQALKSVHEINIITKV
jgi:hypothetical protein